jgi:hypothetical protein
MTTSVLKKKKKKTKKKQLWTSSLQKPDLNPGNPGGCTELSSLKFSELISLPSTSPVENPRVERACLKRGHKSGCYSPTVMVLTRRVNICAYNSGLFTDLSFWSFPQTRLVHTNRSYNSGDIYFCISALFQVGSWLPVCGTPQVNLNSLENSRSSTCPLIPTSTPSWEHSPHPRP